MPYESPKVKHFHVNVNIAKRRNIQAFGFLAVLPLRRGRGSLRKSTCVLPSSGTPLSHS